MILLEDPVIRTTVSASSLTEYSTGFPILMGLCCHLAHNTHHGVEEDRPRSKMASLQPIPVDCDILTINGLHDEIRNDSPIIGVHARPICVEDAYYPNINIVLPVVVKKASPRHACPRHNKDRTLWDSRYPSSLQSEERR